MRTIAELEGGLGEAAGLHVGASDERRGHADGKPLGWIVVFVAALFLTALLGAAQVAGPEAQSVDEDALANLAHAVD